MGDGGFIGDRRMSKARKGPGRPRLRYSAHILIMGGGGGIEGGRERLARPANTSGQGPPNTVRLQHGLGRACLPATRPAPRAQIQPEAGMRRAAAF